MGYLIELDLNYGLITWPQPEPDNSEREPETTAPAEVLPEAPAASTQPELNLG